MNSGAASQVVREQHGDILLVTIDNPPVNALGVDVRRGLMEAIDAADGDASVKAIVLAGAGRNFLGGADIREFGKP
ncbi:MAG TPA: 3-hydroxyacyl-CoA dehydrogenase, partial [Massilia sp.]|nr:3-hydroxyacyl-CoA dehydrogenase [Massilia sp.]